MKITQILLRVGIPTTNNRVYSKEVIQNAIDDIKEDKLYVISGDSSLDNQSIEKEAQVEGRIKGEVTSLTLDDTNLIAEVEIYDQEFMDRIANGCSLFTRGQGNLNFNKGLQEASDYRLTSLGVCPTEDNAVLRAEENL